MYIDSIRHNIAFEIVVSDAKYRNKKYPRSISKVGRFSLSLFNILTYNYINKYGHHAIKNIL
tara:strand:- start:1093 stop:1278 length:186 start_codon:yes stop_codon:yes gene_type:complete